VAAHLEPEILLVDEVLAVGDAQFQKKCLGKMEKVSREEGKTVLFVSHNMQAIKALCNDAILLHDGMLVARGSTEEITELYLKGITQFHNFKELERIIHELPLDPAFRLERVSISQEGHPVEIVSNGLPLEIEIEYYVLQRTTGLRVYFDICDTEGTLLFRSFHDEDADGIPVMHPGHYISKAVIPADLLGPIQYEICFRAAIFNLRNCMPLDAIRFRLDVENTGGYNKAYLSDTFRGKLALVIDWETRNI
jgi:lipopolysaccharide transport system ATP-binding protein